MKNNVSRDVVVQPLDQSIRLIPLTKDQNAIVDAADYDWLMQWNWTAKARIYKGVIYTYYARRQEKIDGKIITQYMHQALLGKSRDEIDHRNGNGLDNRRSNIYHCTVRENQLNRHNLNRQWGRPRKSGYNNQRHYVLTLPSDVLLYL